MCHCIGSSGKGEAMGVFISYVDLELVDFFQVGCDLIFNGVLTEGHGYFCKYTKSLA